MTEFLEDRRLLAFTPALVANPNTPSLSDVVATPANLPVKLVTIMNNSKDVVFPILYDANSTLDLTAGKVVRITLTAGGSGYSFANPPTVTIKGVDGKGSGATATAVVNGDGQVYALNLTASGAGYTPGTDAIVEFDPPTNPGTTATAVAKVSTMQNANPPFTSLYDPLDAFNKGYRGYIGEANTATGQVDLGLLPGHQVTIQVPLVFWDGGRLFFASNGSQPLQSATDPGNPLQNTATWNYVATAASFLVTPDSGGLPKPYSANFADPTTGYANANGRVMWYRDEVAHDFGTDGPGQLTEWTIRDPLQVNYAPNMDTSQIQKIFNYDVSYVDNLTLPAVMEITGVPTPVPPDYAGEPIVTKPYAALGTDLSVAQMQQAMAAFIETSGDPNNPNADLGDYFGGRGYDQFYLPGGPGGIDFDKLPAGYNLFAVAPNNDTQSQLDISKYQLVSGGNRVQVDTHSTGIAVKDSNQITGVDPVYAAQFAEGMLYKIVNWPLNGGTMPIFPQGTYITKVEGTTLTLSHAALQDGPNQSPGNQLAYTFAGSQFVSNTGSTNGTTASLTNVDPKVGIYLRPGMLVAGPGITAYTTIQNISADYKTLTLTGGIPAAASGSAGAPYRFTGAPASYVVSTLINNWYSWADYYVNNVDAVDVPNVTGSTHGTGSPVDDIALLLDNLDPAVVSKLRVGDVVTGPNIVPNANPNSPNTTIAAILSATSIQLSNPVLTSITGSYSFSKPQPIPRSADAQPYTLSFDPNVPSKPGQDPLEFARSVYDVMQGFSHLNEPTYLSQSALLLQYCIGCNIGTFALQAGQSLPVERVNQLRDQLKSILRGVADFGLTPEFSPSGAEQWYPAPSEATPGAMIDKGAGPQPATFGVYNLNPYVWFIHIKLGMSGYGFSVDDDTANAQDAADNIQVAYGGTASTAPGPSNQKIANLELYTFGAPFGTLHDQGYIDITSGVAKGYDLTKYTVINGLSLATVGKLKAFDAKSGQGALVTGFGMTEGSSRVYFTGPSNPTPNTPSGANSSYVVLLQASPAQDGPTGPYTFSGFTTTLPTIPTVSPTSGAVGTSVTLTGTGFTKALGVTFNGLPAASFQVNSDTSITATVPVGATGGKIGVRGPSGTGYSTTDFNVVVNRRPLAAAGPDKTALEGQQLKFDGSKSSDPDRNRLTYHWNFGDGTTATGAKPNHKYVNDGVYTVTLTVSDGNAWSVLPQDTLIVSVANAAPKIQSTAKQLQYVGTSPKVNITGTYTDAGTGDTHTATINWGDGATTAATIAASSNGKGKFTGSHVYKKSGVYTIAMTLTDSQGAQTTRTTQVVVVVGPQKLLRNLLKRLPVNR